MFFSIRHKIALTYALLFILVFFGLGVWLSEAFSRRYQDNLETSIKNDARLLAGLVNLSDTGALTDLTDATSKELDVRVTVVDKSGAPLAESARPVGELENHFDRPEIQTALAGRVGVERRYSTTIGDEMLYVAAPVVVDGSIAGVLRLSRSLEDIGIATRSIRLLILAVTMTGLGITWIMGWLLVRVVTRPLAALARKAKDFGQGRFNTHREIMSNDEMGELEQVFDNMAASIIQNMGKQTRAREQVEQILRHLPVGVLVISDDGTLAAANNAAQEILGILPGGESLPLTRQTRNWQVNQFVKALQDGNNSDIQEFAINGEARKYIRMQGALLEKDKEVVVVLQDITDLRLLEQQRRDLVANVSHELRTPLTAIQGFAETLLEEEVDDATTRRFIDIIRQESLRLSRLINDLLNLSRLESKTRRKRGFCNLAQVTADVAGLLGDIAKARGKKLTVEVPRDIYVSIDRDYVEQILMNYIDNAVKYTPDGTKISVGAEVQDDGYVRIVVLDNGPGIPPQEQKRLFERFFRVDKSRGREEGGTGLGLAIVKHIVEGFGGQAGLISHPGSGTSFWATLPVNTDK